MLLIPAYRDSQPPLDANNVPESCTRKVTFARSASSRRRVSSPDIPHSSVASYLIYGLVYVVIGMFMLRKADAVTSYSYPSAPGGLSPGGNDEEPSTRV